MGGHVTVCKIPVSIFSVLAFCHLGLSARSSYDMRRHVLRLLGIGANASLSSQIRSLLYSDRVLRYRVIVNASLHKT